MHTVRRPSHNCPNCRTLLDSITDVDGNVMPKDGDFSICLDCGHLLVIEGNGVRNPTSAEMTEIAGQKELLQAIEFAHQFRQWRARQKS